MDQKNERISPPSTDSTNKHIRVAPLVDIKSIVDIAGEDGSTVALEQLAVSFELPVVDKRSEPVVEEKVALLDRLRVDDVYRNLTQIKEFLGIYTEIEAEKLSIEIIDGTPQEMASGQVIDDHIVQLRMASMEKTVANWQEGLRAEKKDLSDQQCKDLILATCASTILHESQHAITNSKSGSRFSSDLQTAISDILTPTDIQRLEELSTQDVSTLADEGLTYAVQGIYAPTVEGISLMPKVNENDRTKDNQRVFIRKLLGENLRPSVRDYIESGKSIDELMFKTIGLQMKAVLDSLT